jgi:hypothetical protein
MELADMFIKYDYAETKDLFETFITLISGTLVLSLTFSEKVIGFSQAAIRTKRILFSAWTLFIVSLISAGLSLSLIAAAAGKILYRSIPFFDFPYWRLALASWALVMVSGALYVAGLVALATAAAMAINTPAKGVEGDQALPSGNPEPPAGAPRQKEGDRA